MRCDCLDKRARRVLYDRSLITALNRLLKPWVTEVQCTLLLILCYCFRKRQLTTFNIKGDFVCRAPNGLKPYRNVLNRAGRARAGYTQRHSSVNVISLYARADSSLGV